MKIHEDLSTLVNVNQDSLLDNVEGLVLLKKKDKKWTSKSLFSKKNVHEVEDDTLVGNQVKGIDVGPCVRTKRKTKKEVEISPQDL